MGCRIFRPQSVIRDDSEAFPKRIGELGVVLVHEKKIDLTAGAFKGFWKDRAAASEKFHRLRDDKAEVFGGKFTQELVKGIQADVGPSCFVEQNDGARTNRTFDPDDNLFGVVNLRIKGPCVPCDQSQTPRGENRMQKGIFDPSRRTEPDWRRKAKRRKSRLESVNLPGQFVWSEAPKAKFRMRLGMVADGVAGLQYHMRQARIFCGLCADQKECGASPIFLKESKDLRRGLRIRTVIYGQPDCTGGCRIFCYDRPEFLQRWNKSAEDKKEMGGKENA